MTGSIQAFKLYRLGPNLIFRLAGSLFLDCSWTVSFEIFFSVCDAFLTFPQATKQSSDPAASQATIPSCPVEPFSPFFWGEGFPVKVKQQKHNVFMTL